MILYIVLGLIAMVLMAGFVYMNSSPQMGGKAQKYDSGNFRDGKFQNLIPTSVTSEDYSMVVVEFDENIEVEEAKQKVKDKIDVETSSEDWPTFNARPLNSMDC